MSRALVEMLNAGVHMISRYKLEPELLVDFLLAPSVLIESFIYTPCVLLSYQSLTECSEVYR